MTHKPLSKFVLFWKSLKDQLTVDPKHVYPLLCFQWGCSNKGKPDLTSFWIRFGRSEKDYSLFHNGLFFLRLVWSWRHIFPLGIHWSIRWSGKTNKKTMLQTGIGPKLNGQAAFTFRFQSDETSADGTYGANFGQAQGWRCGPH